MPLISSRIGNRSRTHRGGFTLLELMLVLGIVALIAGVAGVSVARVSAREQDRATLDRLVRTLLVARVEAMSEQMPRDVRVRLDDSDRFMVDAGPTRWSVDGVRIAALEQEQQATEQLQARFDASGRTRAREWAFSSGDSEQSRIWIIRFDPISGVARLDRLESRSDETFGRDGG